MEVLDPAALDRLHIGSCGGDKGGDGVSLGEHIDIPSGGGVFGY